jgi:sugar-specific transcriptional regulator TrmB
MEQIIKVLEKLELEEKDIKVYLALLALGPSPIRKIAEKAKINRGTTHGTLKNLQTLGLVSYYHKESHQHFVAEDPKNLLKILSRKKVDIQNAEIELEKIIPDLYTLSGTIERPIVTFFEGFGGVRTILEDALESVGKETKKEYAAFSSATISPYLYDEKSFPNFNKERIKKNIHVRTIASGPGGTLSGNDERKWLTQKSGSPTYKLIYAGKVAMISLGNNKKPHGLIIEDKALYETELQIFNSLWQSI